jgi:hypothetical protein
MVNIFFFIIMLFHLPFIFNIVYNNKEEYSSHGVFLLIIIIIGSTIDDCILKLY